MALQDPLLPPEDNRTQEEIDEEERYRSAAEKHKEAVKKLPDLAERIQELGLTEEYNAFKDRYLAWRQGEATGAKGDITAVSLAKQEILELNRGFGYYYPNVKEWLWKRSISYWIAVFFFEGSIFLTVSSFAFNQKELLGDLYTPMTLGGFCVGLAMYLVCSYLMCLETVNFSVDHSKEQVDATADTTVSFDLEWDDEECGEVEVEIDHTFYYWPYRHKTARARLADSGAGPLPYLIAIMYFNGVLAFMLGVLIEFLLGTSAHVGVLLKSCLFVVASLLFLLAGVTESIQFCSQSLYGWGACGAFLNFVAGFLFFMASLIGFFNAQKMHNYFGAGSAIYMVASSIQIELWKAEEFGLTFLAVLNNVKRIGMHKSSFSVRGLAFVHMCCVLGALATYNAMIELSTFSKTDGSYRSLQLAFNEFVPALFAHLMLLLTSAVLRPPKSSPFRQLYLLVREVCVLLLFNSLYTFCGFVSHTIQA